MKQNVCSACGGIGCAVCEGGDDIIHSFDRPIEWVILTLRMLLLTFQKFTAVLGWGPNLNRPPSIMLNFSQVRLINIHNSKRERGSLININLNANDYQSHYIGIGLA